MARRGRWRLVRLGKARTGRRGGALRENDWTSRQRHGLAGTEWRMQVGGERLGRVGIEVAGTERKARTGAERNGMVSRGKGYGG